MLKYGFFNSVNGDRKYNADDMTMPYKLIVSDGIIANANGQLSDSFKVKYSSGRQLKVVAGKGLFGGHWCEMTSDELIEVPTPHTQYTRIDSIVIRVDEDARALSLQYLQGIAATNPQAPTIQRSSTIKEYRLANISVAANTTEITQSNITDTRPSADCGIVTNLLQNSDISSTYSQWESQFNDFLTERGEEFNQKLEEIGNIDADTLLGLVNDVSYINGKITELEIDIDTASSNINGLNTKTSTTNSNLSSLSTKVNTANTNISNLDTRIDKLETVTYSPLWEGANQMGASASITPSKKLDECRNGWILVWSGYNTSTNKATETRLQFTYIPKNLMANLTVESMPVYSNLIYTYYESGNFDVTAKLVTITDSKITGFVGNVATDFGKGICLMAVMEW